MNIRLLRPLFWLLLILLAACTPAAPTTPTAIQSLPTAGVRLETLVIPTDTRVPPTDTPSPTPTQLLTATWTVTVGPTNSPTPMAQFEKAQVISLTNPADGFRLAIRVPGLTAALNLELEGRKFTCQMDTAAPETLFCYGLSRPPIDRSIRMVFTNPDGGAVVYDGKTFIIPQAVPTSTPEGWGSCPDRGKKLFCEVECRIYSGEPCIVATCNDACGPYFAIHTCPQDIPNDGICDSDLERQMKDKYGLP